MVVIQSFSGLCLPHAHRPDLGPIGDNVNETMGQLILFDFRILFFSDRELKSNKTLFAPSRPLWSLRVCTFLVDSLDGVDAVS